MTERQYGFTTFVDCSQDRDLFDVVENADLPLPDEAKFEDGTDDLIEAKTGIERRSIANAEREIYEYTSAAMKAIFERLDISGNDCGGIVLATCNSKQIAGTLSAAAARVGSTHGIAESAGLNYACSGFPAAVEKALQMTNAREKHIVIICAEILSQLIDWDDINTGTLFGDGLTATTIIPGGKHTIENAWAHEEFDPANCLSLKREKATRMPNGETDLGFREVINMGVAEGKALYKAVPNSLVDLVRYSPIGLQGTSRIVPHQANGKFVGKMRAILDKQGMTMIPVASGIQDAANTASASIPRVLADQMDTYMDGELISCPAKGAGANFQSGMLTQGLVQFRVGS